MWTSCRSGHGIVWPGPARDGSFCWRRPAGCRGLARRGTLDGRFCRPRGRETAYGRLPKSITATAAGKSITKLPSARPNTGTATASPAIPSGGRLAKTAHGGRLPIMPKASLPLTTAVLRFANPAGTKNASPYNATKTKSPTPNPGKLPSAATLLLTPKSWPMKTAKS